MNEFEKLKSEIPIELEIVVTDSYWLINGKTYPECGFVEKYYFDLYLNCKRREEKEEKTP